ncbi:MAG: hypothetical protein ACFCUL_03950 [Flavobacteriaceae bacterium]
MKKAGLILMIAVLTSISNVFAKENPIPTKKLTFEISKVIQEAGSLGFEGATAEVRITVDSFGKVHLLSVTSTNENFEKFLTQNIDNHILNSVSYQLGIIYRIPIEVVG